LLRHHHQSFSPITPATHTHTRARAHTHTHTHTHAHTSAHTHIHTQTHTHKHTHTHTHSLTHSTPLASTHTTPTPGVSDVKPASIFGSGKPRDEAAHQKREAAAAATAAIQNDLADALATATVGVA
jgi:hypothetical protein